MLNVHAILAESRANGPGLRTVVWFQGCSLGCSGCFNPLTHSRAPRILMNVPSLVAQIVEQRGQVEGITLTGGEPLDQAAGVVQLLAEVRNGTDLSVVLFSGHTMEQILTIPEGPEILARVDVLIAGPYVESHQCTSGLSSSSNQTIHLLTARYSMADLEQAPTAEVSIDPSGRIVVSGVAPPVMATLVTHKGTSTGGRNTNALSSV